MKKVEDSFLRFTSRLTGNALARVQRVHEPADFWTSPFAPADFEAFSPICIR